MALYSGIAEWEYSDDEPYFPWHASTMAQTIWRRAFEAMHTNYDCTPDVPQLSLSDKHLIFVYGTLKRGKHNSYLLKDAAYICPAWTEISSFHMYQTKGVGGRFPVVLVKDALETNAKAVQGELYQVDIPTMKRLDTLEANGSMYKRYRFRIKCGDRFKGQSTMAWMYVGRKDFWKDDITTGKLTKCPSFTTKKDPKFSYYTFVTGPLSASAGPLSTQQ